MRARLVVVVLLAVAGCFPGDECTPFVPGGSELARCETAHQLHACTYDAVNQRFLSRDTSCDAPYTCKDGGAGARCTADPEPYPACASTDSAGRACEGDLMVRCEGGNRVGHDRCARCDAFDADTLACFGGLWSLCQTDADCTTGAVCLDVPNTAGRRCMLPCACPQGERCETCAAVSTEEVRCHDFTGSGLDGAFCL